MTREEIINEINCLLSELDNGEDAVSYLTRNDVNWLNENIKALKQEAKWIPVTERLPDEGYSVLVMRITDDNYKYMRVATYQGDCWMDDTDKFNNPNPHKVIAWMPLPEPYKAESEG